MKKLAQICLIIVLTITAISLSSSVWDSYQKLGSLNSTQVQIKALQEENKKLQAEKDFRQTDFYAEKTAREKLGLSKQDETTFVLPKEASVSAQEQQQKSKANWASWIEIFFN